MAWTASAASIKPVSFEELIDHSDLIVSGQVTRSWSDWDSEHKFIWTNYEVAVSGSLKGSAGANVVISEPGGVVGTHAMSVEGTVGYQTGENVLVFLTRVPNGYLRTTGWSQGKYIVDGKSKLHGASLRAELAEGAGSASGTSIGTLEGMSAAELKSRVAARVRSQAGRTK